MRTIIKTTDKLLDLLDANGVLDVDGDLIIKINVPRANVGKFITAMKVNGNLIARDHLYVGGELIVKGDLTAMGDLAARGDIRISGKMNVRGDISTGGRIRNS